MANDAGSAFFTSTLPEDLEWKAPEVVALLHHFGFQAEAGYGTEDGWRAVGGPGPVGGRVEPMGGGRVGRWRGSGGNPRAPGIEVLEVVGSISEMAASGLVGQLAVQAFRALVQAWVKQADGEPDAVSRERAAVLARWKLYLEFAVELEDVDRIGEAQAADGAWSVRFRRDNWDYTAAVPTNVDNLARPGAVRMTRERAE